MESIELSARLTAFDSFLFLADEGGVENDTSASSNAKQLPGSDCGEASSSKQDPVTHQTSEDICNKNPPVESNVRCIPGSAQEKEVMLNKLSAFDKYMFLVDGHEAEKKTAAAGLRRKTIPKKKATTAKK